MVSQLHVGVSLAEHTQCQLLTSSFYDSVYLIKQTFDAENFLHESTNINEEGKAYLWESIVGFRIVSG